MHEQQSWPDDLALASLRHAVAAFVDLDSTPTLDDLPIAVECAVNLLCRAIEQCEDAGIDNWEILAQLGDAGRFTPDPLSSRGRRTGRGAIPETSRQSRTLCAAENRSLPQTLPHALEELALRSSIAGQHRNKVAFQAQAILAACRRTNGRARILSIGCGGCRDIRSIARHTVGDGRRIRVVRYRLRGARLRASRTRSACRQMHVSQRHGSSRPEEAAHRTR